MYVNTSGGEIQFISLHLVLLGQFFLAELQLLYFRTANRLSWLDHSPSAQQRDKMHSIHFIHILVTLNSGFLYEHKSQQCWLIEAVAGTRWAVSAHVCRSGCGLHWLLFWKGAASCFRLRDSTVHPQHATIKKCCDFYDFFDSSWCPVTDDVIWLKPVRIISRIVAFWRVTPENCDTTEVIWAFCSQQPQQTSFTKLYLNTCLHTSSCLFIVIRLRIMSSSKHSSTDFCSPSD